MRRPGPLATVQDLGRLGMAALGVSRSGAADRQSAGLANRLVGNPADAACLESTFGGLALRFHRTVPIAITGAPCPIVRNGRTEAMNARFSVHAGEELVLGPPTAGVRSYLAVRGGITVPATLGSRSTDVLSGLGPPALRAGDVLPLGATREPLPPIDLAPVITPTRDRVVLRVLLGPRHDWCTAEALRVLATSTYRVTPDSNRIGVRLDGPPLTRARTDELASEAMVPGAIQVPPSGLPVVFLADHPTTGGYPVVGVVLTEDLPLMAQAGPGQAVSFTCSRR